MSEGEFTLTDQQKRYLLKLARMTVEAQVEGRHVTGAGACDDPVLNQPCGCFVTLHVDGQLRGCIGTFEASEPLYQTVITMAKSSLRDPRFLHQPIRSAELERLDIEISVLSPLKRTDDPAALELGKHGIYIRRGYHSGCFLPQVATETGWNTEQFLSYCCSHKAGLPHDAWKDPDTEVLIFTAVVFNEHELNG